MAQAGRINFIDVSNTYIQSDVLSTSLEHEREKGWELSLVRFPRGGSRIPRKVLVTVKYLHGMQSYTQSRLSFGANSQNQT